MLPQVNPGPTVTAGYRISNLFPAGFAPPAYNPRNGQPLAGTQLEVPSKQTNAPDPNINKATGVPLAGTTVPVVGLAVESNDVRNSLPPIVPAFGAKAPTQTGWLVFLAAVTAIAAVFTAAKVRK